MEKKSIYAKRIEKVQMSSIRIVMEKVEKLRNQGKSIVSLCAGEPDFNTPAGIKKATMDALNDNQTHYSSNRGYLGLRKKVAHLLKKQTTIDYDSDTEIIMTCGCSEAINNVCQAFINKDDEVIIFTPAFVSYQNTVLLCQGIPVEIPLKLSLGFQIDIEEVKNKITKKTKMIILNNPSNPTGTEYSIDFLNELIEVCKPYGTYILCDEVYRGLNQEVSISDIYENGISTSSLSKVFSLAGLRLGWIKANEDVIHQINVRRDYSMISTGPLVDKLGWIALKHKDELILRAKKIISSNKSIVCEWLKENPRFECVLPSGGTVCFLKYYFDLKSETFAKLLLAEKGVFFVPGSCFDKEYYFRLGLAQDSKLFKSGLDELSNFVDEHLIS